MTLHTGRFEYILYINILHALIHSVTQILTPYNTHQSFWASPYIEYTGSFAAVQAERSSVLAKGDAIDDAPVPAEDGAAGCGDCHEAGQGDAVHEYQQQAAENQEGDALLPALCDYQIIAQAQKYGSSSHRRVSVCPS